MPSSRAAENTAKQVGLSLGQSSPGLNVSEKWDKNRMDDRARHLRNIKFSAAMGVFSSFSHGSKSMVKGGNLNATHRGQTAFKVSRMRPSSS